MVVLPHYIYGRIVGLILSDGWMQKINPTGQPRLGLKQSIGKLVYLISVFFLLSHYCLSYHYVGFARINAYLYPFLYLSTRSLACFTELYT